MTDNARKVFIIAEAGVNHNGSLDTARRLVDAAADAGADAVKFQSFTAEALVTPDARKADYQIKSGAAGESQLEMLKRLELTRRDHEALIDHCAQVGVEFLSTPFDADALQMLVELGVPQLKLPSGEITNGPLLYLAGRSGLPVILSTGMSTLAEVEQALGALACGYTGCIEPGPDGFANAFDSDAGHRALLDKVTLLHCTSSYPAPLDQVNLLAMDTLAARFGLPVGYSDHTQGAAVALAAAARGAAVIEKHFTLGRDQEGPDHAASIEPDELAQLVAAVRAVERCLGTADKQPAPSELETRELARKSVVAATTIASGEAFSEHNLTCKRPGGGVSPMEYWKLLGTIAAVDYQKDEPIRR